MKINEHTFDDYRELKKTYDHYMDYKVHERSVIHSKDPRVDSNNNSSCTKLSQVFDSSISSKLTNLTNEGLINSSRKLLPGAILVGKAELCNKNYDAELKSSENKPNCSVHWMYRSERGWMPFSESNNIYIESKYKSKIETIVIYPYQIDFTSFVQTNLLTGTERRIVRDERNSLSLNNNQGNRELLVFSPLLNLLSFNPSGILRNIFNFLSSDNNHCRKCNTSLQAYSTVAAKPPNGGNMDGKKIIIPRLSIENCKENLFSNSTNSTASHTGILSSSTGGYMTRSLTKSGLNVENKGKCSVNACRRVVQSDVVSTTSAGINCDDIKDSRSYCSDMSACFEGHTQEEKEGRFLSFCPETGLDDEVKTPKICSQRDLENNTSARCAKTNTDLLSSSSSSSAVSNNSMGKFSETIKDGGEKPSSKSQCGSKSLFFFTPHKYRKSVGIIVPRILSCRFNNKKATKSSEEEANNKYVRFSCGLISPEQSKNSLGGYISTPRRVNLNASKEFRSKKKSDSGVLKEVVEKKAQESSLLNNSLQTLSGNTNSNSVVTDNFKAFSVKSAFIILNEDAIPFDISDNKPASIFNGGGIKKRGGVESESEGSGGYLTVLNNWSRIGRMQSEFFETMSEREFSSQRISMDLNDFEDDEAVSDTDARFLLDEDSRKLISLGNFDNSTGNPRPINWWFNHSVRHITVKLNCEGNFNKKPVSLEIVPLLRPLLTGYMNEQTPIIGKLFPDIQVSGISSHVLLGLKSLEIIGLRPNRSEFPKISEFCFNELNNIIPISLEELYIVQTIVPISIFSLLLTRFPVPAASTFSFSLICNDDELPNTGLQTIQVINLHLSQNPCSHIKRRNRYGISKGRRNLTYSGDSVCSHVHLDIFRKYNHVKICPWLAISNFVDEFVLRTPILVKCIIDPHNIMVVPSINFRNLGNNSRSSYEHRDTQGSYGINNIGELSRGAEFVIMTANLILPLLIIQSHSIQNIIIGGEIDNHQSGSFSSKNVTKLRVDSMVFSCKYLPFKFFKVRNLDLFLDLNIDKTELGLFIKNNDPKDDIKSFSFTQVPEEKSQVANQACDGYCFQQLYNSIDCWIDEFSSWLDKYVCCDSIEILHVNLYVTSRYLELKVNNINSNNSTNRDSSNVYYGIGDNSNSQKCKHFYHDQDNPETECSNNGNVISFGSEGSVNVIDCDIVKSKNIFNFEPFYQKFSAKCKVNHNSLNDVKIKVCISSHLQNFIFDTINLS
ncbi:WWE domain [Cryptosporidium sp. chipmunk genotype I]|uniref:WWE domain n=1 Tax=Cryptosporidium sp. chipmunk genotype I TaxID=1280935 RepID=UPI00351A9D81|nr:WWE domain [Cryptosporidium sp. chipmunk genotype I]